MDWYKRYIGDYQRDTSHLSLTQHGVYTVLLDHYYAKQQPLPVELPALNRLCRATTALERAAVRKVADEFFPVRHGERRNARADAEIRKMEARSELAKQSGHLSVESRWPGREQPEKTPSETPSKTRSERLANARRLGTHTKEEWEALVAVCGDQCVKCGVHKSKLFGGILCKDHIRPVYQGGADNIDNLQPMCRHCNAGKGPDSTDLRPSDWRERLAKRLANGSPNVSVTPSSPESRIQNQDHSVPSGEVKPSPRSAASLLSGRNGTHRARTLEEDPEESRIARALVLLNADPATTDADAARMFRVTVDQIRAARRQPHGEGE